MPTMAGKAFVDTNVLLRAMVRQMKHHQEAETLIQTMWDDGVELWINRQVIREYLVQATHPNTFEKPLSANTVVTQVGQITRLFRVADDTADVTSQLISLMGDFPTGGKQVHDANIVATMLAYDIDTLLTANITDFKRFESKITLIPLVTQTTS